MSQLSVPERDTISTTLYKFNPENAEENTLEWIGHKHNTNSSNISLSGNEVKQASSYKSC